MQHKKSAALYVTFLRHRQTPDISNEENHARWTRLSFSAYILLNLAISKNTLKENSLSFFKCMSDQVRQVIVKKHIFTDIEDFSSDASRLLAHLSTYCKYS